MNRRNMPKTSSLFRVLNVPPLVLVFCLSHFLVAKAHADGFFVAAGGGGRVMTSSDGVQWTAHRQWSDTWADDKNLLHWVTSGAGKIVVAGGGGWAKAEQAGHLLVSSDGREFKEIGEWPNRFLPVLFGDKFFVAAGGGGDFLTRISTDAETWSDGIPKSAWQRAWEDRLGAESLKTQRGTPHMRRGAFGNGLFLITGDTDKKLTWQLTTRDGTTIEWLVTGTPKVGNVAFGAGRFVLGGRDGVFHSTDAHEWQKVDGVPADDMTQVVWSGTEFVASDKKSLYRSLDGLGWTAFGSKPPGWIAAASEKGFLCMSWGQDNLSFSTDAIHWQKVNQPEPRRQMTKAAWVPQP